MKVQRECYVVGIVQDQVVQRFYAIDSDKGDEVCFPEVVSAAKMFLRPEDALAVITDLEKKSKEDQMPYTDGTVYPHSDVIAALKMNSDLLKPQSGQAVVLKIVLEPVYVLNIHGQTKKPAGFKYD